MAFNVRSGGKATNVPVPSTVESGDVVAVGALVGIAEISAQEGEDGDFYTTLALDGIAHAQVEGTVEIGDVVYADGEGPGTVGLTATAGDGPAVGVAVHVNAGADPEVFFKIVQTAALGVTP